MPPYHKDITLYFQNQSHFNPMQQQLQNQYQTFSYQVDGMQNCPEKSVAMRKLLESFDAAMRAVST